MADLDFVTHAQDSLTVSRVYGEPFEMDGATIIPAARLRGGAGGGTGDRGGAQGTGGGFGLVAQPAGAFVLREGNVRWRPALNLNRIILGGQVVASVALLALRAWLLRR